MKPRLFLCAKSLAARFLDAGGAVGARLRAKTAEDTLILMYHRVLPEAQRDETVQAGMLVFPETFAAQMNYLAARFTFLSLGEFLDSGRPPQGRPSCLVTFDDGWRDFRLHAYPALKALGVPAVVFLPTDFIGTDSWFWTDRLAWLLARRDGAARAPVALGAPSDETVGLLEGFRGETAARLERAIALLKPLRLERVEAVLAEFGERWGLDPAPPGRAFLTWEEAREMRAEGLVSFGSHTAGHRILTTLSESEIREELGRSRDRLLAERVADKETLTLCFPNGDYNGPLLPLVREAGYRCAMTTERGWHGRGADPLRLRRVGIHQDMSSSDALFGCRIAGLL